VPPRVPAHVVSIALVRGLPALTKETGRGMLNETLANAAATFGDVHQWWNLFIFLYPLVMAYVWMSGALFYWMRHEHRRSNPGCPPALPSFPKVALVVPCYNEAANVEETVRALLAHNYPDFEVVAVNDGSRDETGAILERLAAGEPRLRVVHQENQGKAIALNTAALVTDAEFLVCIDGDAILHPDAARWMVWHFLTSPRVGAVTGNPRVRTRSTLLGRIQVGEFSSIIGLIKRAQRVYGRVFTVSGVVSAFRKRALAQIGYWNSENLTEDIDVSWRLQLAWWDVRYEPAALCWILMPETLRGLWQQRLRWATGGMQAMLTYAWMFGDWKRRRMWTVYAEFVITLLWAYSLALGMINWLVSHYVAMPPWLPLGSPIPGWTGVVLATTGLVQVIVGMFLDRRYDQRFLRNFFWVIWYPLAYWAIAWATTLVAFPRALARRRGKRARWTSPDRGVRPA
jgi:biofilm PGA synthesis N-glycosyltransferase PgaC